MNAKHEIKQGTLRDGMQVPKKLGESELTLLKAAQPG